MDTAAVLQIVLLVLASAACGFVIWATLELVKTLRSTRVLVERVDMNLIPLLEKADVTIDAVNVELLRIDEIVTRVEQVTDRLSSTSRTVQEVANAPAEIVNDIADKVRRAFRSRKHASTDVDTAESTDEAASPEPSSEAPTTE